MLPGHLSALKYPPHLANVIRFLNPILSSEKPSEVIAKVGTTIITTFVGHERINWTIILTKVIAR